MTPYAYERQFNRAYSFVTFKKYPLKILPVQILLLHTTESAAITSECNICKKRISAKRQNQRHGPSVKTVPFYYLSFSGKSFVMLFAHIAIVEAL